MFVHVCIHVERYIDKYACLCKQVWEYKVSYGDVTTKKCTRAGNLPLHEIPHLHTACYSFPRHTTTSQAIPNHTSL